MTKLVNSPAPVRPAIPATADTSAGTGSATIARAVTLLTYDPETGLFRWKHLTIDLDIDSALNLGSRYVSNLRQAPARNLANERRRAFYWTMLDVAAKALTDATDFPWDQELLHDELRRRLKLGEEFVTPSGSVVFKPRSTSNRAMGEIERAHWTDRCANVLAVWLGVPMDDLMREARERNAA